MNDYCCVHVTITSMESGCYLLLSIYRSYVDGPRSLRGVDYIKLVIGNGNRNLK